MEKPWDVNQDLTQERIIKLANFIVSIRAEVIEMHDEELGDTRLSLGIRAYECCRSRLIALSESEKYPWLSIITPEGRFTFCIGKTPVRFIRHDPKELPHKKLIASPEAKRKFWEQSLFPGYKCEDIEIRWFFVIDSYYKHPADMVYFVGYDKSGDIRSQWTVPIEERIPFLSATDDNKPEAVDIPAPKPTLKEKTDTKTDGTDGKE